LSAGECFFVVFFNGTPVIQTGNPFEISRFLLNRIFLPFDTVKAAHGADRVHRYLGISLSQPVFEADHGFKRRGEKAPGHVQRSKDFVNSEWNVSKKASGLLSVWAVYDLSHAFFQGSFML